MIFTIWLLAGAVIAALGVVVAARRGQLPEVLLVWLPAGLLAAFYTVLPSFTTLRFLLPRFALLSIPVGLALASGLTASRGAGRKAMAALLAAGMVAHLRLMLPTADRVLEQHARSRIKTLQLSDALRPLVDGQPCLVAGVAPRATAYYLRAASRRRACGTAPSSVSCTISSAASSVAATVSPAVPQAGMLADPLYVLPRNLAHACTTLPYHMRHVRDSRG